MDLKQTYNKIAKDWTQDHLTDDWWVRGIDKFAALFKKDDLILDVGCASGLKSKYLMNKGLKVIGFDLSDEMIKKAKKNIHTAKFYVLDMREVDKIKENFDGIFAHACILHIPKKETLEVIKKLASKLKSGGYFYVAVKEKKKLDEEIVKENDYGYEYERFFSYYTIKEIRQYFDQLGMKIVWETITNSRWIQVIAQK